MMPQWVRIVVDDEAFCSSVAFIVRLVGLNAVVAGRKKRGKVIVESFLVAVLLRTVDVAARHSRVGAKRLKRLALDHKNLSPFVGRGYGRGRTRSTETDHNDVGREVKTRLLFCRSGRRVNDRYGGSGCDRLKKSAA